MIHALSLFVLSAAAASLGQVYDLSERWSRHDLAAGEALVALSADPDPEVRAAAVQGLTLRFGEDGALPPGVEEFLPRIEEVYGRAQTDSDPGVLRAAAFTKGSVLEWKRKFSKEARATRARHDRWDRFVDFMIAAAFWVVPVGSFAALLWTLVSRLLIAGAASAASKPATRALRAAREAFAAEPALLLAPATVFASSLLPMAAVVWTAFTMSTLGMTKDSAESQAVLMMLRPEIAAAYFAGGLGVCFGAAVFLRSLGERLRGAPESAARSLAETLSRWRAIAALSLILFGFTWAVAILSRKLRERLSGLPLGLLIQLSAWLLQAGAQAGALFLLAEIVAGEGGLEDAARRARERFGSGIAAPFVVVTGVGAFVWEAASVGTMLAFLGTFSMPTALSASGIGWDWSPAQFGLPLWVTLYHISCVAGVALAAVVAAASYAMLICGQSALVTGYGVAGADDAAAQARLEAAFRASPGAL